MPNSLRIAILISVVAVPSGAAATLASGAHDTLSNVNVTVSIDGTALKSFYISSEDKNALPKRPMWPKTKLFQRKGGRLSIKISGSGSAETLVIITTSNTPTGWNPRDSIFGVQQTGSSQTPSQPTSGNQLSSLPLARCEDDPRATCLLVPYAKLKRNVVVSFEMLPGSTAAQAASITTFMWAFRLR